MKKKILTMMIAGFFCLNALNFMAIKATDEIPTVTFDGTSSLKYSANKDNFSQVFQGIHSGEERTLSIKLENTSDKDVDFFMNSEVLNSLEDGIEANGAGYNVSLKLIKGNETTYLFGSADGALVGADENGLYDLNGALNEKYLVTSLDANQEAILQLSIGIDGTTSRNEYQASTGEIQFDFSVTYEESIINNVLTKVVTGDPTTITTLMVVLLTAGAIIYVSGKRLKGDKK